MKSTCSQSSNQLQRHDSLWLVQQCLQVTRPYRQVMSGSLITSWPTSVMMVTTWPIYLPRHPLTRVKVGYRNGPVMTIDALAPGRFHWNFIEVIPKLIMITSGWGISREIALKWLSLDLSDDKSTLVQVMAWCRQATSHYLTQCWPGFMSPYGLTWPECAKYH